MVYEIYYFLLFPFILLAVIYYFVSLDKIIWFIILVTPLSINLRNSDFNLGISLPGEPFMMGVLLLFIVKLFYHSEIERNILKHPITIAFIINICWMFITSITSTLPWVSFKFLLSRMWFIVVFYYYMIHIFKQPKNVYRFAWAYIVPFTLVIFYTLYMHSTFGFTVETANWVMNPFYNDHTIYGAILAMYLPFIASVVFTGNYTLVTRAFALIFLIIFGVALILSYTRAAWISLALATIIYLILVLKINRKIIVLGTVLFSLLLFGFKDQLLQRLEKNRQDSSSNLSEHVQSISNISSDASNLERINRWQAAYRMIKAKPVMGFGPGTYSFKYAPYQFSYEKTIISTNAGNKGNAHSEYIGPMAESGIPGGITIIILVITIFYSGIRLYYRMPKGLYRNIVLSFIIGLTTYFIHGFLNNFLDMDKATLPVFGFAAAFVAFEIYHQKDNTANEELTGN